MQKVRALPYRSLAVAAFALLLIAAPRPAQAASKEIIELQTQVQQLLDNVQRIQSTLDTRFGVLQNLAQQTADNALQMNTAVNALQQKLAAQNEAVSGKLDTASGQVQALNDSVDELKSRLTKLDKSIQDLQAQLQNIQNPPTSTPAQAAPESTPIPSSAGRSQAPPLKETLQAGVRDYNAAKYELASSEFQDVIRYYPLDDLAGTAQFYLGEIAYRQQRFDQAVKAYNAVLEAFTGNRNAPTAQLHKGLSLLKLNKKEAGVGELRALVKRHPQTPEAAQARAKLNALGVKPSAVR
jgi:TolA-binding protein